MDPTRYPVALSSWAVHKAVGFTVHDNPNAGPQPYQQVGPNPIDIRDFPAQAKAHGFGRVELCHFHLDRSDPRVIDDLRNALEREGVVLQSLLIDDGDLAHPDPEIAERHERWIASWLQTASLLGAERARVVGGRTRREGDVEAVAPRMRRLADGTRTRIVTENWLATLCNPDQTLRLLDLCDVGLNVDLGNWTGAENLAWIERIAGRAETCHAKCEVVDGENRLEEFGDAIDAAVRGGYAGPLTLVNGAASDREWEIVGKQKAFVESRE